MRVSVVIPSETIKKHMPPSSEETPGHTGQELRVSLEFFSLPVLRFVVAHRRPPNKYIFTPYLSQEHRVILDLKLFESFLTCKTSTTRELPKELPLFLKKNQNAPRPSEQRYGGLPTNRAKITQRQGGEKYKKGQNKQ